MMDKNAVKEVRKQLKELERAQAKLQKEYDKVAGGRKKKEVVDEDAPVAEGSGRAAAEIIQDFATQIRHAEKNGQPTVKLVQNLKRELEMIGYDWKKDPSALELLGDFIKEDNFELNESVKRMQKLAGLITENDIKKKLSLKEEYSPEQEKAFNQLVYWSGQPNILIARRYSIQNNMGAPTLDWAEAVERGRKGGWFKDFWPDNLIKILASKPDLNSKDGEALQSFFSSRADDIKNDALRSAKIFNDPKNKPDATEKLLIQDYESLAKAVDAYVKAFKA